MCILPSPTAQNLFWRRQKQPPQADDASTSPCRKCLRPFLFCSKQSHSKAIARAQISRQTQNRRLDGQTVLCAVATATFAKAMWCCSSCSATPKTRKTGGYNQSARFGHYWAKQLGVPFLSNMLLRKNETKTLVRMSRKEHWKEVKNAFVIETNTNYKHVLLVDDVITTGATLTACGNALLEQATQKISILGMAYAQNILP
mgnify:CR=1 FL=1